MSGSYVRATLLNFRLLVSRGIVVVMLQILTQLLFIMADIGLTLANHTRVIVDVAILPVAMLIVVANVSVTCVVASAAVIRWAGVVAGSVLRQPRLLRR